jgi:hypothetical protein
MFVSCFHEFVSLFYHFFIGLLVLLHLFAEVLKFWEDLGHSIEVGKDYEVDKAQLALSNVGGVSVAEK